MQSPAFLDCTHAGSAPASRLRDDCLALIVKMSARQSGGALSPTQARLAAEVGFAWASPTMHGPLPGCLGQGRALHRSTSWSLIFGYRAVGVPSFIACAAAVVRGAAEASVFGRGKAPVRDREGTTHPPSKSLAPMCRPALPHPLPQILVLLGELARTATSANASQESANPAAARRRIGAV